MPRSALERKAVLAGRGEAGLNDRKRVDALFAAALELAPPERQAFLARECETAELRAAVERLLAASERNVTEPRVGAALWQQLSNDLGGIVLAPGDCVGAWRIVGELGRGGMAVVYLAERADGQYQQRAALKMMERAASDLPAMARFHRERQILARLEHPNIARLLDGGIAPDGRPYFVMELVEGSRLDTYCDRERLDLRRRLALFAQVGRAVAAAHRQLVVHRDIKPANILVAHDGSPKLLDFGIAKLIEEEGTASAADLTRALAPMTPRYASPEQAAGAPVTTASDVYQLGLLLCELLAGERAFEPTGRTPSELEERAATRQPARPSAVVTRAPDDERAQRRGCASGRQLRKLLAGDLDTVVLTALRPEAERRYESASRLVEDVERYLAGRPILARPDSPAYRARKFVGRNRWAVAASATGLAAVVGLSVFYAVRLRAERDTARQEAEKARQVSRFLEEIFQAPDPYSLRSTASLTALELLDEGAAKLETGGDASLVGQPVVQAAMLHTIGTVYRKLVRFEPAERLVRQALELRVRELGEEHPETLDSRFELAKILAVQDRSDEALALHQQVLVARRRVLGAEHLQVAASLSEISNLAQREGLFGDARQAAEQAIAIYQRSPEPEPLRLAWAHLYLGRTLSSLERSEEALASYRHAIDLLRSHVDPHHPSIPPFLSELATVYYNLGRLDEGLRSYHEALEAAEASPRVHEGQTAVIRVNAAHGAIVSEQYGEALKMADQGLPVLARVLGPDTFWIGIGHYRRARALHGLGRSGEGLQALHEARRRLAAAFGEASPDVILCDKVGGTLLAAVGRQREAVERLRGILALAPSVLAADSWIRQETLDELGRVELEHGDLAAAENAFRQALELGHRLWPKGTAELTAAEARLGTILLRRGDRQGARQALERALALLARVQGVTPRLEKTVGELEESLR